MKIVRAGSQDPELNRALAGWLGARLGLPRPFREPYSTMGVFQGGKLSAVVIFENYRPENGTVEIGGASASAAWLPRSVMKTIFDFAFKELGCQMAIFRTAESNKQACRFLERVGFELVVIPRLRGRSEAEHMYCITDDAWDQNHLNRKEDTHA